MWDVHIFFLIQYFQTVCWLPVGWWLFLNNSTLCIYWNTTAKIPEYAIIFWVLIGWSYLPLFISYFYSCHIIGVVTGAGQHCGSIVAYCLKAVGNGRQGFLLKCGNYLLIKMGNTARMSTKELTSAWILFYYMYVYFFFLRNCTDFALSG